ncbi:MAG: hypothetical protein ABSB19_13005 [Methylomonas sp.]
MNIEAPNTFAYFVLLMWPLVVYWLYKRKSVQAATFWAIVGGFMWLPCGAAFDFPMIPALNKETLPNISAWFACMAVAKIRVPILGKNRLMRWLILIFLLSPFITVLLNGDVYQTANGDIAGITLYDAFSILLGQFLYFLPFILARAIFKTSDDHILFFRLFGIAALIYALPILFEIRMSPQLHAKIYGFFPGQYVQQMRDGGFRAPVFMGHALWVAIFLMAAMVSTAVLWRLKQRIYRFSAKSVWLFLLVLVILQKTLAPLIYAIFATILIKFFSPKNILRIVSILLFIGLSYPILSVLEIFPHQWLVEFFEGISHDRSLSLAFRFANEKLLLDHAQERLFFGWGSWGRNRVYAEWQGNEYGTTDGMWIITIGAFGLVNFFAQFGLIAVPAYRALKLANVIKSNVDIQLLLGHGILVAMFLIDQIPNASLSPWVWLICGALQGRVEYITKFSPSPIPKPIGAGKPLVHMSYAHKQ